jgi:hypothetical protein
MRSQIPVLRVEGFSGTEVPYYLTVLADADLFSAGSGYWVKAEADGIVTIAT